MATVKLTEAVGNRQKGEVLRYLDSASAHNLVENRKVAIYFDPDAPAEPADPEADEDTEAEAVRSAPRRGGVIVTQVVEEDNPNKPATDADDTDADSGDAGDESTEESDADQ